jgi:hypothetical protein
MNLSVLLPTIAFPLLTYFVLVWYFFPDFYSSQPAGAKGMPVITQAGFHFSSASASDQFNFSVTGFNLGHTADIQIVSISFPNLTGDISKENIGRNGGYVKVKEHNFTQTPLFVATGDTVGMGYSGGAETVTAKYPSIEFFSRPWKSKVGYGGTLEIASNTVGRFVILVKAISLPYFNTSSHYPQNGVMDYQHEFVEVYPIHIK